MATVIKNEWLADLLAARRDVVTEYWIQEIRLGDAAGYATITDDHLREELPPTVDSMIGAFRTGDTTGPRLHAVGVIRRRLAQGFLIPDIQMSLHALETAVMRIVGEAAVGAVKELAALRSASTMYYLVALIAANIYEQLRAEQQTRFAAAYELGIVLRRTSDLASTMDMAVHEIAGRIGAESVAILLEKPVSGRKDQIVSLDMEPTLIKAMPAVRERLGCGIGCSDCPDSGCRPGAVGDFRDADLIRDWSKVLSSRGYASATCVPLAAEQKRIGCLFAFWKAPKTFSELDAEFMRALAGHTASALQGAILYEEARGKRELGVLLEASRLFASSLDTQDLLRKIARTATEGIRGDLAVVLTVDQQEAESPAVAYYAGSRAASHAMQRIMEVINSIRSQEGFASLQHDLAEGTPLLFNTTQELPEHFEPLAGTIGSGIVAPIRHQGTLLGAFSLLSLKENVFSQGDLSLAAGLAELAAAAITNARSYEHERNIAETLQRIFLPSQLPDIDGYETAAYYRPAKEEAEIGGDFYDVFRTDDGNTSIIIGDVSGKGLEAAVPTAMAKYMVRAFAAEAPSPASVMDRFGRLYPGNAPEGLFMTAFYAVLDPTNNVLTYVSAGHNPPMLYSCESGTITELSGRGICIGVIPDARYQEATVRMKSGDVLLLYTDGATDVRGDDRRLEVEGLRELLIENALRSAGEIVREISVAICKFSRGRLADDVALVVLKRTSLTNSS